MVWKDCGYISLTKDKTGVSVIVKHGRYWVKLQDLKAVLDGKVRYILIYEPQTEVTASEIT